MEGLVKKVTFKPAPISGAGKIRIRGMGMQAERRAPEVRNEGRRDCGLQGGARPSLRAAVTASGAGP